MLLLHDERFSGWTLRDKLERHHFSLEYMRHYRKEGLEPLLYTFHEQVRSKKTFKIKGAGIVKAFPVSFRFPPFLRFGNDHSPRQVLGEMLVDQPDIVHFHGYQLASFPYVAAFVKKKLRKPLIAQLHGYNDGLLRRWLYLPCFLALRHADRIMYSYEPERELYRKLGLLEKAEKFPVPGVDAQVFRPEGRVRQQRFLYVGRIPAPEAAHGEKSPYSLICILRSLLRREDGVGLDIVGDGPGLSCARDLARRLGISDRVAFHGYVPNRDLPRYYRAAALTFSPIRVRDVDGWFDGSIQESLACGTPVAAFKASRGSPLRGTFGFLLSNEVEKAAVELHGLMRRIDEADEVAAEGSRFVRQNCSYERVAGGLGRTIEECCSS